MSMVLNFPQRHVRASSVAAKRARASKVIPSTPLSSASRDNGSQRADGMPRLRQQLTAGELTERAEATLLVPPSASMTESDVIMPAKLVCAVQTCQGFATRKATFSPKYGAIDDMMDPPAIIANRLRALRIELGFKTQVSFAQKLGIDKSTYNLYETGTRPLTFETACLIRREFGISVDWLFFGDLQQSAIQTMARIGRGTEMPAAKPKRSASK